MMGIYIAQALLLLTRVIDVKRKSLFNWETCPGNESLKCCLSLRGEPASQESLWRCKGLFPAPMIAAFHLHVGQVPQLLEEGH